MPEFHDTFGPTLKAVFGRTCDGPFHLNTAEDSIEASADKALMLFVMSATEHVWCDLSIEGTFGITLAFRDKKRAYAAADKLNPSFVSVHKNGAAYLTYLFSDDEAEVAALADDLMQGDTDDVYTSVSFPLPYGDISLSGDDSEVVAAGAEFLPVTVEEFEKAFFASASDASAFDGPEDGGVEPESSAELPEGFTEDTPAANEKTTAAENAVKRVIDGIPTEMWNDAEVYGDLDEDLLKKPVRISRGKSREDKNWTAIEAGPVELFFKSLTKHEKGDKEGTCFVPGVLAGPQRTNNAVTELYMMAIDVDSGESMVETAQKIQDMGLMALLYTTHSNGVGEIEIKQDKFFKWATDNGYETTATVETVKAFLTKEGKYTADVINSVSSVTAVHLKTGIQIVIQTRPIDKFRIVFLLDEPYVIAKQKMAQKDAIKQWGDFILGMGKALNIYIDRAARDCSRLFFYPRHDPKRAQYKRVIVVAGRALDWTKIERVSVQDARNHDPYGQAAHAMGANAKGRPTSPTLGLDLKTWAGGRAHGFQISKVFDDYCPEHKKEQTAAGKFTVTCPFDEDHSNAGDPEDKGCFICDAGMDHETFAFRCSHDSCSGRDRLDMLNKAFVEGWFPDSILTDDSYYEGLDKPEPDEDEEESDEDGSEEPDEETHADYSSRHSRAIQLAAGMTAQYSHEQISNVLKLISGLKIGDATQVANTVKKNAKITEKQYNELMREVRREMDEIIIDKPYNSKKESKIVKNRFTTTRGLTDIPFVLLNDGQKKSVVEDVIEALKDINMGRKAVAASATQEAVAEIKAAHGLFTYGEAPTLVAYNQSNDTFELKNLDKHILNYFMLQNLYLGKVVDGNSIVNEPAPDWLLDLVLASASLPLLPLNGLSELPYFNEAGEFVIHAGYDTKAKKYLKLKAEAAAKFAPGSKLYMMNPTIEDIDFILEELFGQVFANFPFDDGEPTNPNNGESSRAHFLCMLLQPLVRYMINGPCPMYRINKPAPGTGASKLINSAMMISYGKKGTPGTLSMDEEENRKNITAQFSAGRQYIFYDNINVPITSTALAIIATSNVWQDRILGRTALTEVANYMQVILAGNNISASEENSRRMLNIQLNLYANPEDPSVIARRTESYKIKDLDSFVEENKDVLFGYLVTLVQYWINQGAPRWAGEPLASYEEFCKIMGGILEAIEMPGFLGNRDITAKANSTDEMAWLDFFTELVNKKSMHEKPLTMAQIIQTYLDMDTSAPTLTINGTNWRVTGALHDDKKFDLIERMVTKQANKIFNLQIKGEHKEMMLVRTVENTKVVFQLVPNPHAAKF